tara:strand:- start:8580 stop:8834 length:255 start_codon:yes stop_codon:yes gene_type:complete
MLKHEEDLFNSELDIPNLYYRFVGAIDAQVRWGSNDDPRNYMIKGGWYKVKTLEVHGWYTKVGFEIFPGLMFNSSSFEKVNLSG